MGSLLNGGLRLLKVYYKVRGRKGRILRFLNKKEIINSNKTLYIDKKAIKVAAVQVEARLMKSTTDYTEYMYDKVSRAVQDGAHLVVFPENNGLQLLGMIPAIGKISNKATGERDDTQKSITPGDIFRAIGPQIEDIYKTVFSSLSRKFGIYIMGGSIITSDNDGNLSNTAYLFGPDGSIIGKQDKMHLMPIEKQWGIKPGCEINVFNTSIGRIAFPVCMDATYFETFRILEEMGAEIIIVPIANPQEFNHWFALRGIWPRVQESLVYGIKSAMVGELLGMRFTGKSGIYCNIDISQNKDGVIGEAKHYDKEDIIIGDINLLKLETYRERSEIYGDRNRELYQRYFPKIYEQSPRIKKQIEQKSS